MLVIDDTNLPINLINNFYVNIVNDNYINICYIITVYK